MKVNVYGSKSNTGVLNKCDETIEIRKNRWIDSNGTSHPMNFTQPKAFSNKNVYWLNLYGVTSSIKGKHISLSFFQNQAFMWMQKIHPLQDIKYVIGTVLAIIGLIISLLI